MSRLLENIKLPPQLQNQKYNDLEMTLAKILVMQEYLNREKRRIYNLISPEEIKHVENSLDSLSADVDQSERFPEYLSVRDVSKLTGLAPQVVRRHCASGKYEAEQVAGENSTWRIKPDYFMKLSNWDKFLKEREEEAKRSKNAARIALQFWGDETSASIVEE